MNRTMRDQHENKIRKLVPEIMTLAFKAHTETDYCVFCDLVGHVNSVSISIRKSSEEYEEKIAESGFYFGDKPNFNKGDYTERLERIKKVRDILKELVETGEIDTSSMDEVNRASIHYAF